MPYYPPIMGTNSLISDEVPTGLVNSSNTVYTAARAYIAGSLEVFINGVKQARTTHFTETTPASGIFTMSDAPLTGDNIIINYQFNLNPSSNADTVDGIHANATATANQLYPLNASAVMPGSVITQVSTNRLNNGTGITETTAKFQTGWAAGQPGAASTYNLTVTFPQAFTTVPIVTTAFGGDTIATTSTLGAGGSFVNNATVEAIAISTTLFVLRFVSTSGANWAAGNTVYAQWIAIGA